MILEDKFSWRRLGMLGCILISTTALNLFAMFIKQMELSSIPVLLLSGLLFCVILSLGLEANRIQKGILDEKASNFTRVAVVYAICCAGILCGLFMPIYTCPLLVAAAVMSAVTTPFLGLTAACYFSLVLCLAGDGSVFLFCCYLLLAICGCILSEYAKKKENLTWAGFMALTFSFCAVVLFLSLEMRQVRGTYFLYGIAGGIISCVLMFFFYRVWYDKIENKKTLVLTHIIESKYELVKVMKDFSQADYTHARKVSKISKACARLLAVNEDLAAAAGFYYRLGRLEGEPYVENGVLAAVSHGFPPELIRILGEYNGEQSLPSTVESALVHIVDNVVAKFDVLDRTTLSSSWNQDIVIYQTLNDNSAKGLYDKSGLSMNMFLIIRDYLIKEANYFDGLF